LPPPAGPVVANNTPLVALWVLDRLDLLRDLFGEIMIPVAVRDEYLATDHQQRQVTLEQAPWITVAQLREPRRALVYVGLDHGEAAVLALAEERKARLVIIDERQGRRYARRLDIPLTWTLGVLLLAKEAGLLAAVEPVIEELQDAGLYLSPALVEQVLKIAEED
jgi:uncharacterized protein